ncbi:glycosyltransferase [Candidatus Saccharibacteria bacterium]|nr:glycosyltransferase [Candidatus Saccharibacteria bacterium]
MTKKRLKIAIFTDVFLEVQGGIPSSISAQRESLEKQGHEVVVFCPGFTSPDKNVFLVPTHRWLRFGGAPLSKSPTKVMRWIRKNFPNFSDFDVVHVQYEASCSMAGMKLARQFNIPVVQTMHGREDVAIQTNIPHPLKTFVGVVLNFLHSRYIPHRIKVHRDRRLAPTIATAKMWTLMVNHANFADIVTTPSKHFALKLQSYGVSKKIVVVSNGVADEMVEAFDKKIAKAGKSLVRKMTPGEPLRLFWNSRLSNEKRIMPFLCALTLMKEPFFFSACGDGNAYKRAQRFIRKNGLESRVKLYGRVPHEQILDKMSSQHLSVTVSYGFDTQGLTLLEAEAVGLPVFFCDPDMREIVPSGAAVIAAGPSPEEMAAALDEAARHPEKIEEMSKVMLRHRKEILQSIQIKKLLDIYESF